MNAQVSKYFTFMFRELENKFRNIADILMIQEAMQSLKVTGLECLQKLIFQRVAYGFDGHSSNLQRSLDKLHLEMALNGIMTN